MMQMSKNERVLNLLTGIATVCAVAVTSLVMHRHFSGASTNSETSASARQRNRVIANWRQQEAAGRRLGPADAAVTILYYGDFECPACRAFTNTLEAFRRERPRDLSVVFRHLPLPYHRFAYPSARAAECAADQGQFEAMYRALFAAQDSLGLVTFVELARRAGVRDLAQFERCAKDTAPVPRIAADQQAAKTASIPGTPGVIINGLLYAERLPSTAELDSLVRDARAKARSEPRG